MPWQHLSAIAFAAATVLVLAIAVNLTHGLADAATMLAVIALIVGAYALRNYARRRLVYQSRPPLNTATAQLSTSGMGRHPFRAWPPRQGLLSVKTVTK